MSGTVQHDGFSSAEYKREHRKYTERYFGRRYGRTNTHKESSSGSSMLAKMGICSLLAGLVLLSELVGENSMTDISANAEAGYTGEDYPGKLRFVELPGIIQVFSSDAKAKLDVQYAEYSLNENNTVMKVSGIESQALPSPADGTVKTVSVQDNIARTELSVDGDILLCFSAYGEPAVEEGQPVKVGDTLYSEIQQLEISVYKAGRPINPEEFFDMTGSTFS